jgi:hypothetical protein
MNRRPGLVAAVGGLGVAGLALIGLGWSTRRRRPDPLRAVPFLIGKRVEWGPIRGVVIDAGGGQIGIMVDRETVGYPPTGTPVSVVEDR